MARVAHEVMVEAERAFRRADALAAGMEPHLLKRVNDSAIYGYTNERPDRNVPPGDVLLAAALAAGISLDHKLGIARDARDSDEVDRPPLPSTPPQGGRELMDDLRSLIAEMRDEMASLRAELMVRDGAPAGRPEATPGGPPPSQPAPSARRGGRGSRP
jgi:hypothetical protein